MKKTFIYCAAVALGMAAFTSCSDDELKGSKEAAITEFEIESNLIIDQITSKDGMSLKLIVADHTSDADLKFSPKIAISEGATISPESGAEVDLSKPVTYIVKSENRASKRIYTVECVRNNFSIWETTIPEDQENKTYMHYQTPIGWATSNMGTSFMKAIYAENGDLSEQEQAHFKNMSFAVTQKDGAAAIQTVNSKGFASIMPGVFPAVPNITAGTLFLGEFDMQAAMSNTLNGTKFGIPYARKPIKVTGKYSYTPGTDYYHCANPVDASESATIDNSKSDEFSISAVLYEVSTYETTPNDERLTGETIYSSSAIAATSQISGGSQSEFKDFTLTMTTVKPYDPSKLYRFAIILSSSKNGNKFSGAPGSILTVKDIKVVTE